MNLEALAFTDRELVWGLGGLLLGLVLAFLASRKTAADLRVERNLSRQYLDDIAHLELEAATSRARYEERLASLQEAREQMADEFHTVAGRVLEARQEQLLVSSRHSLDALLRPLQEQIQLFRQRVDHVHQESVRDHSTLAEHIRQVVAAGARVSDEAGALARALKGDNKVLGNWGEMLLEQTLQLAGLRPDEHYRVQASYRDAQANVRRPDVIVNLPGGRHIVIDSKVSLLAYQRAMNADTDELRRQALDEHVKALRRHIDELSGKDYSSLAGIDSPGFVLMFLPVDAACIEAFRHDRELFGYGSHHQVMLVSPATLLPVMKTVANVWVQAESHRQAAELSRRAGDVYNQVVLVAERLKRLGLTLDTASRHYNDTVRAIAGQQGLFGKVQRFGELSSRANRQLPDLEPVHADFDDERLDLVVASDTPPHDDSDTDRSGRAAVSPAENGQPSSGRS